MSDDYQYDDCECPKCGHAPTHSRDSQNCDEMNEVCVCIDDLCRGSGECIHGDGMDPCPECAGTGIQRWCPKCGADYWRAKRAARAAHRRGIRSRP
jgi:hypothetical protein